MLRQQSKNKQVRLHKSIDKKLLHSKENQKQKANSEWEKISTNHISNKELVSMIYKTHTTLYYENEKSD